MGKLFREGASESDLKARSEVAGKCGKLFAYAIVEMTVNVVFGSGEVRIRKDGRNRPPAEGSRQFAVDVAMLGIRSKHCANRIAC